MQSVSFLMHSILLFVQQMYICFTKIRHFSKKAHKTLKKLHIIICVLKFIHIFAAVEKTKIFIRCVFLNKMQPKTTE